MSCICVACRGRLPVPVRQEFRPIAYGGNPFLILLSCLFIKKKKKTTTGKYKMGGRGWHHPIRLLRGESGEKRKERRFYLFFLISDKKLKMENRVSLRRWGWRLLLIMEDRKRERERMVGFDSLRLDLTPANMAFFRAIKL